MLSLARTGLAAMLLTLGLNSVSVGMTIIQITNPNGNTPGLESINFIGANAVPVITGETSSGVDFYFSNATTSATPDLHLISSNGGVAALTAAGKKTTFTQLTVTPEQGFATEGFAFRVQTQDTGGSITISALDQLGVTFAETFALVKGQNNFYAQGLGGELITSLKFTSTVGLETASQFEVGNIVQTVPEPSSVVLLGLGSLGVYGFARRKSSARRSVSAN